jgi:hypothetical protein
MPIEKEHFKVRKGEENQTILMNRQFTETDIQMVLKQMRGRLPSHNKQNANEPR